MVSLAGIAGLVALAETAVRAAKAVSDLRKTGNTEAAAVLEAECTRACKAIVRSAARRRQSSHRAGKQHRNSSGKFTGIQVR